jgi:hypothetical protein
MDPPPFFIDKGRRMTASVMGMALAAGFTGGHVGFSG